jgi:hypothetical protein
MVAEGNVDGGKGKKADDFLQFRLRRSSLAGFLALIRKTGKVETRAGSRLDRRWNLTTPIGVQRPFSTNI